MSWASRRQFTYLFGLFAFCAIGLFLFLYPKFNKPATCTDGKMNGTEVGVDCGGVCQKFCPYQMSDPIVLWSRAFPVNGTTYNLLSYVENQNKNGGVPIAKYEFRIYDENNKLIGRREGQTFIPPNGRIAVFESRFDAGQSIPKNVTFEFTGDMVWVRKEPKLQLLPIKVDRIVLGEDSTSPMLSARITNDSIFDIPAFDVITVLYDSMHNAIAVSKTHLDELKSNGREPLLFTWPLPFSDTPVTKDVLPQINPFYLSL